MLLPLSPTQQQIQTTLVTFLSSVLPDGDAAFTASISGGVMTVTGMLAGSIVPLDAVLGEFVAPGTSVTSQLSGTAGEAGNYAVSPVQQVSLGTMSTGVDIYQGQDNLVSQSPFPDQVVVTPIRQARLATNIDQYADALFVGSIAGGTMTISQVQMGALAVGSTIFGVGVAAGTVVTAFGTGIGGAGTYAVAPAQTVAGGTELAAGVQTKMQETEVVFQLDVHGPNSADFAQVISTMFRDAYATTQFAASGLPISPLHADDPTQRPFTNENQQIENRWVIEAHLQADQTVVVPQQFTSVISVIPISVEAPPYP